MRGVKPCGREQKAENLSFSKPVFREPLAELLQIAKKMLGIVSGIKQISADCEGIPWQPPPILRRRPTLKGYDGRSIGLYNRTEGSG
jgi:hypothetical protein